MIAMDADADGTLLAPNSVMLARTGTRTALTKVA